MPEAVCRQTILRRDPFQHACCVGVPSHVGAHITICTGEDWLPSLGIEGRRDRDTGTRIGIEIGIKIGLAIFRGVKIGKIGLRIGGRKMGVGAEMG